MYSQLFAELIPIINKCFNYHQTPIAIGPLSYYLIVELPRINLTFNGLKIVLSLLNLSLTPFQLFQEFLTNVVLNTANLVPTSTPNLLENSHP
jgi:hypothetical protein